MKIRKFSEASALCGVIILGFATALMSKASFGMSVAVTPSYVLAGKISAISTGTMCYVFQGFLIVLTSIIMGKFRVTYLFSFLSAVLFGLAVDFFSLVCLAGITDPPLWQRAVLFGLGIPFNAIAIAFFFRSYFPPQAPELFVRELSGKFGWKLHNAKYIYDITSCVVSMILSLLFFRELRYIGVGTVICALVNAPLIKFFGRQLDKFIDFSAAFPKVEKIFK